MIVTNWINFITLSKKKNEKWENENENEAF